MWSLVSGLVKCLNRQFASSTLALYTAFMVREWTLVEEHLVSAICACVKFSQKYGKLCYFSILPHNWHSQWQWVLISLGLMHNLHRQTKDTVTGNHGEMTMWWLFYFLLCDAVRWCITCVIENNKYGYVMMQKAMEIVNFMHAQMAETRHSFCCRSSARHVQG